MSPIEERFMQKLMYLVEEVGVKGVNIEPQKNIGDYRVDFLITGGIPSTVVECDGHDWHEKTRQQAAHDKKRDRYLQEQGHRVFHFTGSEIHRHALFCAMEAIRPAWHSHLRGHGFKI